MDLSTRENMTRALNRGWQGGLEDGKKLRERDDCVNAS